MKLQVLATLALTMMANLAFADANSFTCFNHPHNGIGYAYHFKRLDKEAAVDIYRIHIFHGEFIYDEKAVYSGVVSAIETRNSQLILKNEVLALLVNKTFSTPEKTSGAVIHSPIQIILNGDLICRLGEVGTSI